MGWFFVSVGLSAISAFFGVLWWTTRGIKLDLRSDLDRTKSEFDVLKVSLRDTQRQQRQLAVLLDHIDVGLLVLDQESELRLHTEAAAELLGINAAKLDSPIRLANYSRNPDLLRIATMLVDEMNRSDSLESVRVNQNIEVSTLQSVRTLAVTGFCIDEGERLIVLMLADESARQRSDEVRREFVANVSHELKTPLAAIKGYAETIQLALEDDPKAASHFMNQISHECVRMEKLLSDMMQLSRADGGAKHLETTDVDINRVLRSAINSHIPTTRLKNLELDSHELENKVVTARADQEATLTIATNLIGNAIRYTPANGRIAVRCRYDNEYAVMDVEDNGIGIHPRDQSRIFERFYRAAKRGEVDSENRLDRGTGIGLSIVRTLVRAMDGRIQLDSEAGRGSRFQIYLPSSQKTLESAEEESGENAKAS
ncbi:MAG: ATP-binding protein [Planctomycetota bacterium]